MKAVLRLDKTTGRHAKFTVFMNGANCGQLTMTIEEARFFKNVVCLSHWHLTRPGHDVWAEGPWDSEVS